MAQQVEVKVPDIGDFKDVAVIEVMVKVGETIAVDTGLVMVESDKASMEIPSSHAGVVKEIKVKVNDKVSEGSVRGVPSLCKLFSHVLRIGKLAELEFREGELGLRLRICFPYCTGQAHGLMETLGGDLPLALL